MNTALDWVNTSTNSLIKSSLTNADEEFKKDFEKLIETGEAKIIAKLDTSFLELQNSSTLWGLLINAGYLTIAEYTDERGIITVRIPNGEVRYKVLNFCQYIQGIY